MSKQAKKFEVLRNHKVVGPLIITVDEDSGQIASEGIAALDLPEHVLDAKLCQSLSQTDDEMTVERGDATYSFRLIE